MRLRTFGLIVTFAVGILLLPITGDAQQSRKIHRIGILTYGTRTAAAGSIEVAREAFRELGYVEGWNIVFEFRFAETQELLPARAAELAALNVDVIGAVATSATLAAKRATATIPIVMGGAADPVQIGLIGSLARPGGNITGIAMLTPELTLKQLELLKEILPRASRIAVLWNATNPAFPPVWRDLQVAAQTLKVKIESVEVQGPQDFERALGAVVRYRPDGLLPVSDPLMFFHLPRVADFALKNRLPTISLLREFPAAGGLMSYGPSWPDVTRRSASYIDKILKGSKPADLPVEQPTRFELVINLKTAKALGLTIPPSVLVRADQVIE